MERRYPCVSNNRPRNWLHTARLQNSTKASLLLLVYICFIEKQCDEIRFSLLISKIVIFIQDLEKVALPQLPTLSEPRQCFWSILVWVKWYSHYIISSFQSVKWLCSDCCFFSATRTDSLQHSAEFQETAPQLKILGSSRPLCAAPHLV